MPELTHLTRASRPRVGPGFRLQWEPAQDCHVLLYPEGMVKLNPSAGEIMKRCDGERSVATIVGDLEQVFAATGLEAEVLAFVELAAQQRWLVWDATGAAMPGPGPRPGGTAEPGRSASPATGGSS